MAWRYYFILGLIYLAAMGLAFRVYDLCILDQSFLKKQGDGRALRLEQFPNARGMILDRYGFPLAVSAEVYAIWANPFEFTATNDQVMTLSHLLQLSPREVRARLKRGTAHDREFVYLKRGLSPASAKAVEALHLKGLYTELTYRRFYPAGEATAQLIGITDIDDRGKEGLELAYNHWLAGVNGKAWVVKDRLGRTIEQLQTVKTESKGQPLVLSIDRRIQYLAYRELLQAMHDNDAASGSVVVLDVQTGEVLAMVNQPSFNPNQKLAQAAHGDLRNRAVTDVLEPGSTIKVFSIGSALEKGMVTPNTTIDIGSGVMRIGRNLVRDAHHSLDEMTVTQVLQHSSNVGVSKIVLNLPTGYLEGFLRRVGFGEETGIVFPGEQRGVLADYHPTGSFPLATLGFGYGLSVTPLQLARAYLTLANQGKKIPITLLKQETSPTGEQVIDPKLAKTLIKMLETVVQKDGTGGQAAVSDYCVAGKTGTSVKNGAQGYEKHRYISSFVGMAPCEHPRLVVAVFIDDPRGKKYYGGLVSGPVFSRVMDESLRILNVPP